MNMRFISMVIALALPASAAELSIIAPPGATVTCAEVASGTVVLKQSGAGTVTVADEKLPLSCEAEGHEPRDVSAGMTRVEFERAAALTLSFAKPTPFEVQWVSTREGDVRILATRRFEETSSMVIPVAQRSDRWIRVKREKSSPVTLPLPPPVGERWTLEVPNGVAGGELFARLTSTTFLPRSIVDGSQRREASVVGEFASLPGLAPGGHLLTARFAGGILVTLRGQFEIKAGETTVKSLPVPPLAALAVSSPASICREGQRLVISRGGQRLAEHVVGRHCSWEFEGLLPLATSAALWEGDSLVASASAILVSGARTDLQILSLVPVVSGRAWYGEEPAAGVTLRFRGEERAVETKTDAEGMYEVRLPSPGEYDVDVRSSTFGYAYGKKHSFVSGPQELDITVPEGRLIVSVKAEGATSEAMANVTIVGPSRAGTVLRVGSEETVEGLEPGDYDVFASAAGLGRAQERVTLTEDDPEQSVVLDLQGAAATIEVTSPRGAAVPGARLQVPGGVRLTEAGPGVYRVEGATAGQQVLATAPGWEPRCESLRLPHTRIALSPEGVHAAEFIGPRPVALYLTYPSQPCSIHHNHLKIEAASRARFAIRNLLPGFYVLHLDGKQIPVTVPGPPMKLVQNE
jgi:hypothetical protein